MASRNYPRESLKQTLVVAQKIVDENAGAPMNRLLVADALGIKPASSNFKYLLSSSRSYGLTEGTEKAQEVSLTPLGTRVARANGAERTAALRQAVMSVPLFGDFYGRFNGNRLPSPEMLQKLLVTDFGVPEERAKEAADIIVENGEFIGVLRAISGSAHVMLDAPGPASVEDVPSPDLPVDEADRDDSAEETAPEESVAASRDPHQPQPAPRPIFIGHGRNTGPLGKLEKILAGFQIPFKVAVGEPNLGRPIPQKVKETMVECGSAILIFTKDQCFTDADGNEVWRPSENVVHELGAASFAYEDRVVIFKERGITLPTNFSSIGYIEFEEDRIEAKTAELLQELIGFGLVKITPAA